MKQKKVLENQTWSCRRSICRYQWKQHGGAGPRADMNQVKLYRDNDQAIFVKEYLAISVIQQTPHRVGSGLSSILYFKLNRQCFKRFFTETTILLEKFGVDASRYKVGKVGGSYEETVTASSQDPACWRSALSVSGQLALVVPNAWQDLMVHMEHPDKLLLTCQQIKKLLN